MILCLQEQKRASSRRGLGLLGLVEAKEAKVSKEIPLLSNHQHSGGESVQLHGLCQQCQQHQQVTARYYLHL